MSGMFLGSGQAFLEPGGPELEEIEAMIRGTIPEDPRYYDFNGDGRVNLLDYQMCYDAMVGNSSLASWPNARMSEISVYIVPSDPQNAIHITGVNSWHRTVDITLGTGSLFNGPDTERNFNMMLSQSTALLDLQARVSALENK
jgi:hypothetical protein